MRGARSQNRDPAQGLMREVGAQLREARLQRGEDLNDVAQQLRIKPAYLFGIEQGDLSAMPGRPYALGFLRTYADYLGFDGEDLITRIKSTVENLTDRTSLRIRAPMPESRLPATPIVVISLAIIAGVYAGWSYLNRSSRMQVDTVAEVPSNLRAPPTDTTPRDTVEAPRAAPQREIATGAATPETAARADPAGTPAMEARDPAASTAASTADGERPARTRAEAGDGATSPGSAERPPGVPERLAAPEAGPSADAPGALAQTAGALAVQPAAGAAGRAPQGVTTPAGRISNEQSSAVDAPPAVAAAASAAQGADARVVLRARERSWIRVSSLSGDYVVTRTLEPGEAFPLPGRSDLELWTGNAGGLEVLVDGMPVPALAGGGAVRRNVPLDPDRLLQSARQPR
jgi:cytoskeleton protein RodZ